MGTDNARVHRNSGPVNEGVSVTQQNSKSTNMQRRNRGASILELVITMMVIMVISAIAILQMKPSLQNARTDNAMREVVDQLRQAREYSRFPTAVTFRSLFPLSPVSTKYE